VALVLIFTVKAVFWTDEPINYQSAIRVDLVALPDKLTADSKPMANPEPDVVKPNPKPEAKAPSKTEAAKESVSKPTPPAPKPEVVNLQATKKKQSEAVNRLKQLSALERLQQQETEDRKRKALEALKGTPTQFKGNQLADGNNSLTGLARMQAESYISDVDRHMRQYWALPEYLRNRSLKTEVLVKFDSKGHVTSKQIVKSSGNELFDEIVLTAIENSSPVPAPPEKFVRISQLQGFLFRFSE
jgi:colicin import membrane protein